MLKINFICKNSPVSVYIDYSGRLDQSQHRHIEICKVMPKNNHTQQQLQRLKASGFMRAVLTLKCRQLCRNLGFRVHFWVKAITIDFQLEKYMPFKEKDVSIFFLQH